MTPEASLTRAVAHLDDALEYLTFEEFGWAFEELWCGVAWCLNALQAVPQPSLDLPSRGTFPTAGTLAALLDGRVHPVGDTLVAAVEALASKHAADPRAANLQADAGEISRLVFLAWELHDACALHLGLVDAGALDGPAAQAKIPVSAAPIPQAPGALGVFHDGQWRVARRTALRLMAATGLTAAAAACTPNETRSANAQATPPANPLPPAAALPAATVRALTPLDDMQWPTTDPFLFCAYHVDHYPAGNAQLGPAASLAGRALGRDFDARHAWRMYHGETVPGFPRHPHRGFETVTVVRTGMLDHADSLGATARYGGGDVQWLTAGGGLQHAEMFPLLRSDAQNPLELFQIWLNLPARDKMVPPYFTMLWNEQIPRIAVRDDQGRTTDLTISAGAYEGQRPPPPPPSSWASQAQSEVAIWSLRMDPGAVFTLPPVSAGTERSVYVHRGAGVQVGDRAVANRHRVELEGPGPVVLTAGTVEVEILLLQGRPIAEPVVRRGPFVMNTPEQIQQAYADYQRTQFGGWPWPDPGPVHHGDRGRFARHINGTYEEPT